MPIKARAIHLAAYLEKLGFLAIMPEGYWLADRALAAGSRGRPLSKRISTFSGYASEMTRYDLDRHAWLIFSLHNPSRMTVAECLQHWSCLDGPTQEASYLVIEGDLPGARQTLCARGIAKAYGASAHQLIDCSQPPEEVIQEKSNFMPATLRDPRQHVVVGDYSLR